MKSDKDGCSVCPKGGESYEFFDTRHGQRIQYDYRTWDGELFSCVAETMKEARQKRDKWISKLLIEKARTI